MIRKSVLRFLFVVLFILAGCISVSAEELRIACTTSLIESIVREVGKEKIDLVTAIVPAGMCPGHFDLRPKDIVGIFQAKILLCHGWEGWIDKLLDSVDSKELIFKRIDIEGNWMIPEIHIQATEKITDVLCKVDSDHCNYFKENAKEYILKIQSIAVKIKKLKDIRVISSRMQAPFLEWLGIKVVATYGRPDELTPSEMVRLIKIAKEEKVSLIVDNLQSGPNAGRQIAEEVKARHITLTNFPLRGSYIDSLEDNIKIIVQALE